MHDLIYFYPEGHQAHFEPGHPERPDRVDAIRDSLREAGWWDPYPRLEPAAVPVEVLRAVHSPDYLAKLERVCQYGQHYDMDTYTTPASWQLALNAAGGALAVADSVWVGGARRGFALTRPPGHHATRDRAMGFCLMNNIAIAAEYLIQLRAAQRIAIVDLDLHHGNGTQDIFYRRGDVFYISTHQSPLYPGTGGLSETGAGAGQGANANFPLPPMAGDQAFLTVMDELILPLLDRFTPQMILVSYGFDPHRNDPLGSLLLGEDAYGQLIERLTGWADSHCDGRIALCLEGGYDLEAARQCSLAVVAALLGVERPGRTAQTPPPGSQLERANWQTMLRQAKSIWNL